MTELEHAGGASPVRVVVVKTVHTAVFFAELSAICWLVVTGLTGRRDRTVAVAAGAVAAEGAVFVANRGVCPLTPLAERYGAANGSVSDIYLPTAIARTIPLWSSALIGIAALLHLRSMRQSSGARSSAGRRSTRDRRVRGAGA
jgi:hypothetical protein